MPNSNGESPSPSRMILRPKKVKAPAKPHGSQPVPLIFHRLRSCFTLRQNPVTCVSAPIHIRCSSLGAGPPVPSQVLRKHEAQLAKAKEARPLSLPPSGWCQEASREAKGTMNEALHQRELPGDVRAGSAG